MTELKIHTHQLISPRTNRIVFDVITYIFVLLFVYTAAGKLMTIETFKDVLTKYPLISAYNAFIAYLVPITELAVATLLIVPATKKNGVIASLVLIALFLLYIIYMFISKSPLPCSCGGVISKLSWGEHIWFNSIMIIIAWIGLSAQKKIKQKPNIKAKTGKTLYPV